MQCLHISQRDVGPQCTDLWLCSVDATIQGAGCTVAMTLGWGRCGHSLMPVCCLAALRARHHLPLPRVKHDQRVGTETLHPLVSFKCGKKQQQTVSRWLTIQKAGIDLTHNNSHVQPPGQGGSAQPLRDLPVTAVALLQGQLHTHLGDPQEILS